MSEFWKPENLNKPTTKGETINIAELSLLKEFLEKQPCSCYLDVRGRQFADRHKAVAWRLWLGGMPLSQKPWLVSPLHRLCSPSLGINWMSKWVFLCSNFGGESSSETRKSTRRFARANSWYAFPWPWNCCISHWRQRPQHDWGQFCAYCRCIQETKKRQLVTRSNLQRLRWCVCHFHHEQALRVPYCVRHFFAKVLKKVRHFRVDVVAGDATAAAYRYQQRKEYQYFCNFWVAVMLREMQREVNMNRPFQSRRHCDYSTNNKHSQLRPTDYPDCCFMAYSPMEKTAGTQNFEKTLEQHVWAYTEWTKGASWGQLLSWGYWSLADGGGSEELSRSRESWQSYDCTTRQWEQNVIYTRAWHKWHLTWIACRTTGRCSNWEHVESHWRKATNRQIRGRNHKPSLWMIFSGKVEPKWNNVSWPD